VWGLGGQAELVPHPMAESRIKILYSIGLWTLQLLGESLEASALSLPEPLITEQTSAMHVSVPN
jgi:hypothetical protein